MSHSVEDLLHHIFDEIEYLIKHSDVDEIEYSGDETLQRAFTRSLEIIGEAVKKLPDDFKEKHKGVNWKEVAGMRDVLIHEYFGVDYEIIWSVVKYDIPELKKNLEQIKFT